MLYRPIGTDWVPRGMGAESAVVTSTRPIGPAGHSPRRSAEAARSSSTTSQDRPLSFSQPSSRAATGSALPTGAVPVIAAAACP
ncbi:MAG TPA: hypothetical protein VGJ19_11410 [Streptosporangiaceae bacterium]